MSFTDEDVTCCFTLNVCARLTVDAVCCLPCCCGCGGCCGRCMPCVADALPDEVFKGARDTSSDVCMATCTTQFFAACLMPWTLCGCFWACCGLATPCARCAINTMIERNKVSPKANQKAIGEAFVEAPPEQRICTNSA